MVQKIVAVIIVCVLLQCRSNQQDRKPKKEERFEIKVGKETLKVKAIYKEKDRRKIFEAKDIFPSEGLFLMYKQPRYIHLYLRNTEAEFSVAFINKKFQITQICDLRPDKVEGITSENEVPYALFTVRHWFSAKDIKVKDKVEIPEKLKKLKIEETPYVKIKEAKAYVEIVSTEEQRARGLKYRTKLSKNFGMLFVYKFEDYRSFWMEDTRIPLSIAFIKKDLTISSIHDMKPFDKKTTESEEKVMYALEMNKGWFKKHKIKPGDKVKLPQLKTRPKKKKY
jgi:hypothetical protein